MNYTIISGGQTGIDQIALEQAVKISLSTGGTACKGWLTETGPEPELLKSYGLSECLKPGYPARTAENVNNSDVTLIFSEQLSPGSKLTIKECIKYNKPYILNPTCDQAVRLITDNAAKVINFAGSRGSRLKQPEYYKVIIQKIMMALKGR